MYEVRQKREALDPIGYYTVLKRFGPHPKDKWISLRGFKRCFILVLFLNKIILGAMDEYM